MAIVSDYGTLKSEMTLDLFHPRLTNRYDSAIDRFERFFRAAASLDVVMIVSVNVVPLSATSRSVAGMIRELNESSRWSSVTTMTMFGFSPGAALAPLRDGAPATATRAVVRVSATTGSRRFVRVLRIMR